MSDRAWASGCSSCASGWLRYDGPQCRKDPHGYKTGEQRAIVRWLTSKAYGTCPGYEPSQHTLDKLERRRIALLETELAALKGETT